MYREQYGEYECGCLGEKGSTFYSQDLTSNSPYCLPFDSYDDTWENWY